jgi:hypothetical protein
MSSEPMKKLSPAGAIERSHPVPLLTRLVFATCGLGLLVGFLMPWITVGELVSVSGLGLVVSDGQMVSMLSGSHRFLLFAIPALAVVLVLGGVLGNRLASWAAVAGGALVLGYGLFTVIRLFLSSTGLGMWLVIGSAVFAFALGVFDIGRRSRAKHGEALPVVPPSPDEPLRRGT